MFIGVGNEKDWKKRLRRKKAAIAAFFMGENDLKISKKLLDPFLNHE